MKQLKLFENTLTNNEATIKPLGRERVLLESKYSSRLREELRLGSLVSYVGNKRIPFLRLYRYKEAFSYAFVKEFVARFALDENNLILDPFCGMGTTLFVAGNEGIPSIGIDRLPIAVFIAQTLPLFYLLNPGQLYAIYDELKAKVDRAYSAPVAMDVAIMQLAFSPEGLLRLRKWKTLIDGLDYPLKDIFLLLFFSILEACSYTAKDRQCLRLRREKKPGDPTELLGKKINEAERDIVLVKEFEWDKMFVNSRVYYGDTRSLENIPFTQQPTAIITSPPYANRYDYTRTYSLELCFHFVKDFAELKALRHAILRSHIESKITPDEQPPHPAVAEVVAILRDRAKYLNNPRIPDMLTAYFVDMQKALREWSRVLSHDARVALVVDNVRFDGEILPVDLILSDMAESEGFIVEEILIAQYKSNSSQQMGKYGRVPVRESITIWRKS